MKNQSAYRILLVEDSESIKDLVCHTLGDDFNVYHANTIESAQTSINDFSFELIILDIGLPDGDGLRFFSMLQNDNKHKQTPVIFLTAHSDTSSKVLGISLGAEDYIVKPFEPAEFKARIKMRVKKHYQRKKEDHILRVGELIINMNAQKVYTSKGSSDADLQLTPLEFKLFALLATHDNQVFSRNQLFDKIWGIDTHLTDRCVDTHIYALRKKLGPLAKYIQSVYGEGYRFSLPISKSA